VLNAYSHWAISDEFERTAPTLVFLLMLGCRMVVDWQLAKREKEEEEEEAQMDKKKKGLEKIGTTATATATAVTKKDQ
jgi:flagellar biosynthesis component FlhA